MSEIINFPHHRKPNKSGPPRDRDRAEMLAGRMLAATLKHIVAHWDNNTDDWSLPALRSRLAEILRRDASGGAA